MRADTSTPCNAPWKKKTDHVIAQRLAMAVEAGLVLPEDVVVLHPTSMMDLSGLPGARLVQPFRPDHDFFIGAGRVVSPEPQGAAEAVVLCLPRAKREAQSLLARATEMAREWVVVDGQKGDGIDSFLKAVRQRVEIAGVVSKAHGKLFWFRAPGAEVFADWAAGPALTEGGFWTAPGVFSADGIDEGSAQLAEVLPDELGARVADLGAGWGFLTAHVLVRNDVEICHVVEAHHMALQCAEHNVTDPRAVFHWADVLDWTAPDPLDGVVMNPPFHKGKAGDPGLGQAFIARAARMLKPSGRLWMVANRHLPYEETVASLFANVIDLGGDTRFKLICAERPKRRR